MARRKTTGAADDFMELLALLPLWCGLALVLMSYFLLHRVAEQPVAAATHASQIGAMAAQTLWRTFAPVSQYLVPLLCVHRGRRVGLATQGAPALGD